MRVVFLGTPEFALPSLRALIESRYEVCAVFTQPDRPAGRGQKLQAAPVKVFAQAAEIPVYQPSKIRDDENRPTIEQLQPDFLVVAAYGQLLPRWLLELPRIAPINVHASLLPRYRGAAPVAHAILNGDAMTGVTTMLMDEGLDTGPMLLKREVPITLTMTAGQLERILAETGAELLLPTLDGLSAGTLQPVPQNPQEATPAPKITKQMARLSWSRPALDIHNTIRALNPWPLANTEFRGQTLQIFKSFPPEPGQAQNDDAPGTLVSLTQHGMQVRCGESTVLELLEVRLAGRKRVSGREFANGARLHPGDRPFRN